MPYGWNIATEPLASRKWNKKYETKDFLFMNISSVILDKEPQEADFFPSH